MSSTTHVPSDHGEDHLHHTAGCDPKAGHPRPFWGIRFYRRIGGTVFGGAMDGEIVSARVGQTGPIVMIALAEEGASPERDVAIGKVLSFEGVTNSIGAVAESMTRALRAAKPDEAEVEFGVDVGVEAGELTSLIVKGSGTATLRIKLVWRSATGTPAS